MAAGWDEEDGEWATPVDGDVRSLAGWDGEGEGEGTPLESAQDEDDEAQIPLTLDALYRESCDTAVVSNRDDDADDKPRADDDAGADGEDATTCPVCFRLLRDLADTQPARLAHVNACLDGGSGGGIHDESTDVVDLVRTDTDDTFGATWDEGGEGEWHDVAAWLHAVDHGDFAEAAVRLRLTFESLNRCVDEDALASLGHVGDRARRRALLAAVAARRPREAIPCVEAIQPGGAPERDEAPGGGEDDRGENVGTSRKGWHPTRVACGVAPVFARARGELTEPTAQAPARKEPPARRPEASRNVQKRRRTGAENAPVRPGVYVPPAEPPRPPPPWIRVPGTRFIVDGFQGYGKSHGGWWCRHWFLTHFHADHYRGLTKSTPPPGCLVWCSRPTAALCATRLGIQRDRLRAVDVGRTIVVDGVRCTFIDANHCPGAVMIVFDGIPGGTGPVLATGDCRFHPDMKTDPHLVSLASQRPAVMLDTTYCSPNHVFPPQCEVLAAVRDSVKAESFNPRVLFLFGTYTIGKERVFFEAARALGKKVYVGKQKRAVLDALGSAIDAADMDLVTTDDQATNLHVVPMGSTGFARMKTILRYYKNRYDTVVAFKPTGWTFESARKHARATKRTQRGSMIQYSVPYSEHSSFEELREFVKFLKPRAVLPHVGNDRGPKARRMVELLTAGDDDQVCGD